MSDRETALQAIANEIDYWIKYETSKHDNPVTADTHVWLNGYEGAPPHWPSTGQLQLWVKALRGDMPLPPPPVEEN